MTAILTPCRNPACNRASEAPYCDDCSPSQNRRRPDSTARGYDRHHEKWRKRVLAADPVCHWPLEDGRRCLQPASVADHVVPLRPPDQSRRFIEASVLRAIGEEAAEEYRQAPASLRWLRFSLHNGQGLCRTHHAAKTAEEQRGEYRDTRRQQ